MEKAFDNVKWNKLFEILQKIGINYKERRMIYALYNEQLAIINSGDAQEVRISKGVRQGCGLSPVLFNNARKKPIRDKSTGQENRYASTRSRHSNDSRK